MVLAGPDSEHEPPRDVILNALCIHFEFPRPQLVAKVKTKVVTGIRPQSAKHLQTLGPFMIIIKFHHD